MSGPTTACPLNGPLTRDGSGWPGRLLTAGCRYALAAVFLMAALSKITDLAAFEERFLPRYLPAPLAGAMVTVLPWLELMCGLCLALGFAAREAALCTAVLLLLFLGHALLGPGPADCGCFLSPLPQPEGAVWWLVVRNALLLLCSVRVAWG